MAKTLPDKGIEEEKISDLLNQLSLQDMRWKEGKFFGYLYYPGDAYYNVIKNAYAQYSATNALNPAAFPSLRSMENDIISISSGLLGGDQNTVGTLTSGGTESLFLTVLAARSFGKSKNIIYPNIIVAASAHPALDKAAEVLGVEVRTVAVDDQYQMNTQEMRNFIDGDTVMLVASAPSYPHGIIDPVAEIANIAQQAGILCHVDACVGGFILPFLRKNGVQLPDFDLSVPGVTSISADLHKYAYAAKGASVILFSNKEIRKGHYYVRSDWSGGVYGSTSFMGTRGGGPIASAWTALHHIGMEGYLSMAKAVYKEVLHVRQRIATEIPELYICGQPLATLFSLASDTMDVYEIADQMSLLGWTINRQQKPASLHIIMNNIHVGRGDIFVDDLLNAVNKSKSISLFKLKNKLEKSTVKGLRNIFSASTFQKLAGRFGGGQESKRTAAMYGMMNEIPVDGSLDIIVKDMLDKMYKKEK